MNVPIYDGNPIWNANAVPFGFYNSQSDFQTDSVKVAKFCAARLGYPLVDIELQSSSFFTAFEEAVTIYGNELYAYTIRDNQLTLNGGGGWIRTTEARASDLQSDPFSHSGTPPARAPKPLKEPGCLIQRRHFRGIGFLVQSFGRVFLRPERTGPNFRNFSRVA